MGFRINGNDIMIVRGDSFRCKIRIKQANQLNYIPNEDDKIVFAIKNKYSDKTPTLTKEIPFDSLELFLSPEDTKLLTKSSYVYEISITFIDGDVDTFIQGEFVITEEIY